MQHIDCKSLTYILPILSITTVVHFISACNGSNDSSPPENEQAYIAPENKRSNAALMGTKAVSQEALFDFLYVATQFEFWNCVSSDNTKSTYIALDSKDDETDEGFNPLLLLGLSREPQLLVDPRARNDDDRDNNVELRTTPVSFFVTSSDSISITLHANRDFTSSVEDNMIYLTAVRTGPGRAFTAEDKPNNAQINCTANTVGTNIMF